MTKALLVRLSIVLVLLVACIVGTANLAKAASHNNMVANAKCQTTQIELQGNAAPKVSCLDGKKSSSGVTPNTYVETCPESQALELFWNGPLDVTHGVYPSGPRLCIRGQGHLNLTGTINGLNWNDQASAWWAGCSGGLFYKDAYTYSKPYAGFYAGDDQWGNFPYGDPIYYDGSQYAKDNFYIPNDSLSGVDLFTQC